MILTVVLYNHIIYLVLFGFIQGLCIVNSHVMKECELH